MSEKLVNVLMWIPVIGIIIGVIEAVHFYRNNMNWYYRNNDMTCIGNGLWLGTSSMFILDFVLKITF